MPSQKLVLYRYAVTVEPAVKGKKLGQIIKLLLQLPGYVNFRNDIVTDFKSTLISRTRLNPSEAEREVKYKAEGEDEPLADAMIYQLNVVETGTLTVAELMDYLNSTNLVSTYTEKLPILQALNIFLGHYGKSSNEIATIGKGKSFSLPGGAAKLGLEVGLSALRGFFSSVRVATCRILVNVNVSYGVFYDDIRLDTLIIHYLDTRSFDLVKIQSFLKRVRVKVQHLREKTNEAGESIPRVRTIYGFANTTDGQGGDHPPRVSKLGAGSRNVEFFLRDTSGTQSSSSTSDKKQSKSSKTGTFSQKKPQSGRYTSVYDYFKDSM